MYKFYYKYAVRMYGHVYVYVWETSILFTDCVCKDIATSLELFDTSDYLTTHPCYSINNKK